MSNTKPCPYCAEPIQKEAIFCKHCKKDLSTNKANEISSDSGGTLDLFKKNKKWAIAGIVGVLVFVFYLGSQSSEMNQDTETSNQNNEIVQGEQAPQTSNQTTPEQVVNEVAPKEVKTLGISYDQMMNYFGDAFPMEHMPLDDGRERYFGDGEHASLEIIGDKSDISQTTLILLVGEGSNNEEMGAISLRFLMNAVPGWSEAEDWLSQSLADLAVKGTGETKTTYQNKVVKANFAAPLGMVFITVEPE